MDIVTDLTAEAISYLILYQDILKSNFQDSSFKKKEDKKEDEIEKINWENPNPEDFNVLKLSDNQSDRIRDLIWHSQQTKDINPGILRNCYFEVVHKLLKWLISDSVTNTDEISNILFKQPFFWRQKIRAVLYGEGSIDSRKNLVKALRYMPVQVIKIISDNEKKAYKVRLYQFYVPNGSETAILNEVLSPDDYAIYTAFWDEERTKDAMHYLTNDKELLIALKSKSKKNRKKIIESTLPFETFFNDELHEIEEARRERKEELQTVTNSKVAIDTKQVKQKDPMLRASEMELYGIAFSGGGIRSATFNLGVLQRLASLNFLEKFDYISTVSGGGYIGTWYTSWIKRSGSFSKVNDQLNPEKSADPWADEVRPIRWLRMFSNYLSPNVGIMSPDAWATGMTWLRNTFVNQIVLFLVLLTTLSFILDIYCGWELLIEYPKEKVSGEYIVLFLFILGIFAVGGTLAAFAMRSFYKVRNPHKDKSSRVKTFNNVGILKKVNPLLKEGLSWFTKVSNILPHILLVWSIVCSFIISTYLAAKAIPIQDFWPLLLWCVSAPSLIVLFIMALLGNYHRRYDLIQLGRANVITDKSNGKKKEKFLPLLLIFLGILGSSLVASGVLGLLLGLFWKNFEWLAIKIAGLYNGTNYDEVMLMIGVPIVLEIFSLTVIIRMIIMGNLFPDYRREWWGRMGGYVHRFILFWILICFAAFIMPDLWAKIDFESSVPWALGLFGGWAGVVGWGVKIAFGSKDSDDQNKPNKVMNIAVKVVPFVFMIGVLLIGSGVINLIRQDSNEIVFNAVFKNDSKNDIIKLCISVGLLIITALLSWRVGVNEFSLHHFYRNRLVRAFLGATRTREDRIKTANVFTGFDTSDDILLSTMRTKDGYFGPYPLLNTALNATVVSALDRQDRKAESFVFSPLYCGYDFSPTRPSTYDVDHVYEYGYRPTDKFSNENGGPTIGTAMAISGAAVNPNWGYHSSAPMAFLLTIFNVRLGWWIGNTRLDRWKRSDPKFGLLYLIRDLIGKSDIDMDYVCLSDGGHFDNMGIYELIRRRCHYIILGDGEQDQEAACEGLANAIRRCRIDFGVEILFEDEDNRISDISKVNNISKKHIIKGEIIYPGVAKRGVFVYIKAALTGDEPVDIREYAMANPDFPQQSTGDQFFDEAQFESYRKLGYHSIDSITQL